MDRLFVAGIALSLVLAVGLACYFLVARVKRRRCSRAQGQAVTVAELLEDAKQHGEPSG